MAKDFRTGQLRSGIIIGSASITDLGKLLPGVSIYSSSAASGYSGGRSDNAMYGNVGKDVFFFVSGGMNQRGTDYTASVALFGGDVVISGSLYAEKIVAEVDQVTTGSFSVSGSLYVSQSGYFEQGVVVNNSQGVGTYDDFQVKGSSTTTHLVFADASTNQVAINKVNANAPLGTLEVGKGGGLNSTIVLVKANAGTSSIDFRTGGNQGAVIRYTAGENLLIKMDSDGADDKDIIFEVSDGGSSVEVARFDGSESNFAMNTNKKLTFHGTTNQDDYIYGDGTDLFIGSGDDIKLDAAGDIFLDAGGSNILLVDDTTNFGRLKQASGDFIIKPEATDKDIIFQEDGGTEVFRLDSSAETLTMQSGKKIEFGGTSTTLAGDNVRLDIVSTKIWKKTNDVIIGLGTGAPTLLLKAASDSSGSIAFAKSLSGGTGAAVVFDGDENFALVHSGSNKKILIRAASGADYLVGRQAAAGSQVLILSGGGSSSPDASLFRDTNFFVSGTIGNRGSANTRGTSLFGGDVHVSGTLTSDNTTFGQWTDGGSYLYPMDNSGNEDIVIGNTTGSTAGINLYGYGGATFNNMQSTLGDFRIKSSQGSAAIFVSATSGRVGINTAAPSADLSVGTGTGDSTILLKASATKSGSIAFTKNVGGATLSALVLDGNENLALVYSGSSKSISIKQTDGSTDVIFFGGKHKVTAGRLNHQVIILSNSAGGASSANPISYSDTNFWVSGTIGNRGSTDTRGTAVFGGDLHVSGTLTSDNTVFGQWTDGGTYLYPMDNSGNEDIVIGGTTGSSAGINLYHDGRADFGSTRQGAATFPGQMQIFGGTSTDLSIGKAGAGSGSIVFRQNTATTNEAAFKLSYTATENMLFGLTGSHSLDKDMIFSVNSSIVEGTGDDTTVMKIFGGAASVGIGVTSSTAKLGIKVDDAENKGGILLDFDETGSYIALEIDSEASNYGLKVTAAKAAYLESDDTAGEGLKVYRNVAADTNPLAFIHDDHAASSAITFKVQQDGTGNIVQFHDGNAEVFTVADGGHVGIKQTDPVANLVVGDGSGARSIHIDAGGSSSGSLAFSKDGNAPGAYIAFNSSENLVIATTGSAGRNKDIIFQVDDNGTDTEVFRVDGSAYSVAIGANSNTTAKLLVTAGASENLDGIKIDQDDSGERALWIDSEGQALYATCKEGIQVVVDQDNGYGFLTSRNKATVNAPLVMIRDQDGDESALKVIQESTDTSAFAVEIANIGATKTTISGSGQVGIGTGTSTYDAILHVKGISRGDGIVLEDADSTDTVVKIYESLDDGVVDVYANNSVTARIHGNGDSYLNGGSFGIGTASPSNLFTVESNSSAFAATARNTANDLGGAVITVDNSRGGNNGVADDYCGAVRFMAQDSAGNSTQYGKISGLISSPTNTFETGRLIFETATPIANKGTPLYMRGDRVLILSGGASTSYDETTGADVAFYVSGSVGSWSTSTRGTAVFGGDLVISGTAYDGSGNEIGAAGWTDDGTVVRITTSTDSVGIGTSNPKANLQIGGGTIDSGLLVDCGSTSSGSLAFATAGSATSAALVYEPGVTADPLVLVNSGSNDDIILKYKQGSTWREFKIDASVNDLILDTALEIYFGDTSGASISSGGGGTNINIDATSTASDAMTITSAGVVKIQGRNPASTTSGAVNIISGGKTQIKATDASGTIRTGHLVVQGGQAVQEVVVNEDSLDYVDFRVETDGSDKAIYVDADGGLAGIGEVHIGGSGLGGWSGDFNVHTSGRNRTLFVDGQSSKVGILLRDSATIRPQAELQIGHGLDNLDMTVLIDVDSDASGSFAIAQEGDTVAAFVVDNDDTVNLVHSGSNSSLNLKTTSTSYIVLNSEGTSAPGSDVNLLVSGAISSKDGSTRGTSLFLGDVHVSGSLTSDNTTFGQWTDGGSFLYPSDNSGVETIVIGGTSTAGGDIILGAAGGAVFNEQGNSADFRVESNNKTHALFVDGSTDQVLILSGGGSTSYDESTGADVAFYVSGSLSSAGTNTRGTSVFGGDLAVSGSVQVADYIRHMGDSDTYLRFATNEAKITVADSAVISYNDSEGSIVLNADEAARNTIIKTAAGTLAFAVKNSTEQVLILSGGGVTSYDEAAGADVNFYVSGSAGSRNSSTRGTSVFGGDAVISGALYVSAPGTGQDVIFYGEDSDAIGLQWDADANEHGKLTLGQDDHGVDFQVYGESTNNYISWDQSTDTLSLYTPQGAINTKGNVVFDVANQGWDFTVNTNNKTGIFVDGSEDQVLILSGGSAASFNEAGGADVNFYVSGAIGSRGTATRGSAIFGGDLHISGTITSDNTTFGQWSDGGTFIYPADDDGAETVIIGASSINSANIILRGDGYAEFNKQSSEVDFRVRTKNSGYALHVSGNDDSVMLLRQAPAGIDSCISTSGSILARGTAQRGVATIGGDMFVSGAFFLEKMITNPAQINIGTNNVGLYAKDDGGTTKLFYMDDAGTEIMVGGGGSGGAADPNAEFLLLSATGSLTAERVFTTGTGLTSTDAGAGNSFTVNMDYAGADSFILAATDGTGITVDGDNDKLVLYDNDAAVVKFVNAGQVGTTYTAGNGLDLSGTEFSTDLKVDGGLVIDTTELAIDNSIVATITGSQFSGTVGITGSFGVTADSLFSGAVTLGDATGDDITFTGYAASNIIPKTNNTYDLGSTANRWANVYTGDLHLRNDQGNWTIKEDADKLIVINNLTGKKYKMMLEPLEENE